MAAAARVHRGDQLEPRRVGDVPVDRATVTRPNLERLAQRLERGVVELRNYVSDRPKLALQASPSWMTFSRTSRRLRQRKSAISAIDSPRNSMSMRSVRSIWGHSVPVFRLGRLSMSDWAIALSS